MVNVKIKGLKEGVENFLEERCPSCDKVIHQNNDEEKGNINYDFRDSKVGFKNHHIPKIDMRNFDGKDPITWILHMGKYFDLHDVQPSQKVHIASLYLKPNQFEWERWLCSHKPLFTSSFFMEEMIAHYEDTKRKIFFRKLMIIKQKGSMAEHIKYFQKFNIRVTNVLEENRIDFFMGTLKDNMQYVFHLSEHNSLEKAFRVERIVGRKIMATRKPTTQNYKDGSVVAPSLPQPTRLTPQKL